MQICNVCNIPMVGVMSFSRDKKEKFCQCPKCKRETRHNLLRSSELDFGEVLHEKLVKGVNSNETNVYH